MKKRILSSHETERITAADGTIYRLFDDGNHLTFHIFSIERFYPTAPYELTNTGKPITLGTEGYWHRVPNTDLYTDWKQAHDKMLAIATNN